MIKFLNVSKIYDSNIAALKEFTFTFEKGKTYTLFGPSGAGKTTVMKLILQLFQPESGSLILPEDLKVSMVFQNEMLLPHLTAYENILYGLPEDGISKEEKEARIMEAAILTHCDSYLKQKAGKLSGGQRQRVSLARALVKKPDLLLMDEPFSQLDKPLRSLMLEQIRSLQNHLGFTMISISHDFDEAVNIGNTILFMMDGRLIQSGSYEKLMFEPANIETAAHFSWPGMNIISQSQRSIGFFPGDISFSPENGDLKIAGYTLVSWQYSQSKVLSVIDWEKSRLYIRSEQPLNRQPLYIKKSSIYEFDAAGNAIRRPRWQESF